MLNNTETRPDTLTLCAHMLCDAIGVQPHERMGRPEPKARQKPAAPKPRLRAKPKGVSFAVPNGSDASRYWRGGTIKFIHDKGYAFVSCTSMDKDVFVPPCLMSKVTELIAEGDTIRLRCFESEKGFVASHIKCTGEDGEVQIFELDE